MPESGEARGKIKHGDYPNLLLQKWPAPEFICDTTLSLSGLKANEEAGVISMGVKYALLSFARNEEGMVEASFINGEQNMERFLWRVPRRQVHHLEH